MVSEIHKGWMLPDGFSALSYLLPYFVRLNAFFIDYNVHTWRFSPQQIMKYEGVLENWFKQLYDITNIYNLENSKPRLINPNSSPRVELVGRLYSVIFLTLR